MRAVIVSCNAVRIVAEAGHGKLFLSREAWCSDRRPRKGMEIDINDRLEARIAQIAPFFSLAECSARR